jgi:hypothetical protein
MQSTPAKKARENASCTFLSGFITLLISVGLITLAIYTHNVADEQTKAQNAPIVANDPDPNTPVTCDDVPMSPNNICDHIITSGNGGQVTLHYSYEEQQQYQANQRIQQERDRIEAQRSKSPPPTALIGCLSGLCWLFGGMAGLLTLLLFLSSALNVLSLFQKPALPETSDKALPTDQE